MPAPLLPGLDRRIAALLERGIHGQRNDEARAVVRLRARDACEYCLMPTTTRFQVDHIVPPDLWPVCVEGGLRGLPPRDERRGPDHIDNYAWACPFCNEAKGQGVTGWVGGVLTRFFDPQYDHWPDHFVFLEGNYYLYVVGASPEGRATEAGLRFNAGGTEGPLGPRHVAIGDRRYPPRWARVAYGL